MALLISVDTDFGIPAVYWNIGGVQEDFKGKATEITIYGYASQETRQAGRQPLSAAKVQIVGEDYIPEATRAQLYAFLNQRPEFAAAQAA
jgi:hypothetical protein